MRRTHENISLLFSPICWYLSPKNIHLLHQWVQTFVTYFLQCWIETDSDYGEKTTESCLSKAVMIIHVHKTVQFTLLNVIWWHKCLKKRIRIKLCLAITKCTCGGLYLIHLTLCIILSRYLCTHTEWLEQLELSFTSVSQQINVAIYWEKSNHERWQSLKIIIEPKCHTQTHIQGWY